MDWATLKQAGEALGPVLGTGGAVGVFGGVLAYMAAIRKAKTSPPAQITNSQADLARVLNEQSQDLLRQSAMALADSRKERIALKRRVTRLERDVATCHTNHATCETQTARLQEQIDELMAGRVASYTENFR